MSDKPIEVGKDTKWPKRKRSRTGDQAASELASPSGCAQKPPLGIMPEPVWRELRMWELIKCLARHAGQGTHPVHREWLEELRDRLNESLGHNAESSDQEQRP